MKRGKAYREYLESAAWRAKREEAIERAGGRCQLCNVAAPVLHVHHRTYERVGRELPGDLTVLCGPCHRRYHQPRVAPRSRGERRREIDQGILAIVQDSGLIRWRDIQRQIQAPRAQAWARAERLIKGRRLAWKYGKLCLYERRDLA
jgi:hypothetical protein